MRYLFLSTTVLLTAIIALTPHVIILQYFSAPMVSITPGVMMVAFFTIKLLMVASTIGIFLYSQNYWISIRLPYRIILFAILLLALTEQLFRAPIMNIIVGIPWSYQWLESIPTYIEFLTISLINCLLLPKIAKIKSFKLLIYTVILIGMTCLLIFIKQLFTDLIAPFLASLPHPETQEIAFPPYGINILVPAYITFLEPTIAAFIVYHIIKNHLSKFNILIQGLIMGIVIIAIHAGIFSILQIFFSDGNILYRFFYHGQFLWEYLILGMLTVLSSTLVLQQNASKGVKS